MMIEVARDPFDLLREQFWIVRSHEHAGRIAPVCILTGILAAFEELGILSKEQSARLTVAMNDCLRSKP